MYTMPKKSPYTSNRLKLASTHVFPPSNWGHFVMASTLYRPVKRITFVWRRNCILQLLYSVKY